MNDMKAAELEKSSAALVAASQHAATALALMAEAFLSPLRKRPGGLSAAPSSPQPDAERD